MTNENDIEIVSTKCDICGEIILLAKGPDLIPDPDDDPIPPVCGKCYTEYYAEVCQQNRTGRE